TMTGWMRPRARGQGVGGKRYGNAGWLTGIAGLALLAGSGCSQPKPKPAPPPAAKPAPAPVVARPLCAIETANGLDRPARERTFPAQNWLVLRLHGYRSTTEMARPLADGTGAPVYTVF